jgi:hypothetical protein
MVGFALALAGGAARGWGEGQLSAIKATREEKLRQLEAEREDAREVRRQSFLAQESALSRASQEKLTTAQIASQEALTREERKSREGLSAAQIAAQERITKLEIGARKDLSNDQIAAQEKDTLSRLTSAEGIAAADRAAAAPVVSTREGQTGTLESGIFKPTVDKDGKLVNIVTKDNENSADAKTIQYLLDLGTPLEEAKGLVLKNKNADPAVIGASVFNNIMDVSRKNMGNPTAEQIDAQVTAAVGHTRRVLRSMGMDPDSWTPGAASEAREGETPAPAGSDAASTVRPVPLPEGVTEEDAIEAAKQEVANGRSKAAVRVELQRYGIDPSKAGL